VQSAVRGKVLRTVCGKVFGVSLQGARSTVAASVWTGQSRGKLFMSSNITKHFTPFTFSVSERQRCGVSSPSTVERQFRSTVQRQRRSTVQRQFRSTVQRQFRSTVQRQLRSTV